METDGNMPEAIGILPSGLFDVMKNYDVALPSWATMILTFANPVRKSWEVAFFEGVKDFFIWYSKVLIKGPEGIKTFAYAKDESGEWKLFVPPTLIGVNLQTKLRY